MDVLPKALLPLASYHQFIIWKLTSDGRKVPINPNTLQPHNAHDPGTWKDAQSAITTANQLGEGYGTGFVFTGGDPFWFLDIDHCIVNGVYSPIATELMTMLPGAIEISQSGIGLHIS